MHKWYHNANRPPVSATNAIKPYREPSIVLMCMIYYNLIILEYNYVYTYPSIFLF